MRLKQLVTRRKTMRQRLAILDRKLDERDSRIAHLEATLAAYGRAAGGARPPGCARCHHLLNQHRGPHHDGHGCSISGCTCPEYDSGDAVPATAMPSPMAAPER